MSVVLIGSMKEVGTVDHWQIAVLPNRKVLVNPEFEGFREEMENTIKVRSASYTRHTGEEHMPVMELFRAILNSWGVQGGVADVFEDEAAKKIIREAGLK